VAPLTDRAWTSAGELPPNRRSACPGLFRLAPAVDGHICRVRLPSGRLGAAQAAAVANAAEGFGNGIIDATNRGNLQIRGVRPDRADRLIDGLIAAGLGPLAEGGDDVRNVMLSPTAGIDPEQRLDISNLADRLLATLQTDTRYRPLSPKFSVLIDGGEQVAPVEHPHDIWLAVMADRGADRFAFGLAGCPPLAGSPAGAPVAVAAEHAHDLVAAIVDLFLDFAVARPEMTRLRHLLSETGADQFIDRLAARVPFPIRRLPPAAAWRRRAPLPFGHIGTHPQRQDGLFFVGAVPPLGRLDVAMLRSLGRIAAEQGDGTIRLTPWRSVLLPNIPAARAARTEHHLEAIGLVCRAEDPRATMIACSGSDGCASGRAATQRDGLDLALRLRGRRGAGAVHLSGCAKSCAAAMPAAATLVAAAPGRYDLFMRHADGPSRFGRRVAENISIDQAADLLAQPRAGHGT
jgi:precorrin-3B synthase